jgi:hypothetical protein
MVEKLAASIVALPNASRQSTEFIAKATSANAVHRSVLTLLKSVLSFLWIIRPH